MSMPVSMVNSNIKKFRFIVALESICGAYRRI
jgi:hypothetical protein